jgi:hypothetical protein
MKRSLWLFLFLVSLAWSISCGTTKPKVLTGSSNPLIAVAATSGTPQSHTINGSFGVALVATVTSNGAPASGTVVTFTTPSSGPSATFSNTTSTTATGTTDDTGAVTSPALVANGVVGTYNVQASVAGSSQTAVFTLTNTTGAPASVVATSGSPQSAPIDGAFASPLSATVYDSGHNPVSGAVVTFTAPTSGASGTFADSGSNVTTATTNASGVATSAGFTANNSSGSDTVVATVSGVTGSANFYLTNAAGAPASVIASGGTPQSAPAGTAFTAPLTATVFDAASNPVSGVAVVFTAPSSSGSNATGTFSNGTNTETDITNASGVATSSTFTANGVIGGPYTVTGAVSGIATQATFSLTNRVVANTYVFYLYGQESTGPNFYALTGSVEIDPSGNVIGGEQDYNDGLGVVSPQPSGDSITGGTLTIDGTGQGTLSLTTNNSSVGVSGVETLGLQFVNGKHAMVIQFDGTATSSGSFDFQNLPIGLNGAFSFTLTGVDNSYGPVGYGGVFSIDSGTSLDNGVVDTNDNGLVTTAQSLTGVLTNPDSFGRGTITSTLNYSGTPIALNYYVVGPETIRIIDVDLADSALGSAYGQGTTASFTNASLGTSVFGLQGTPYLVNYSSVGMLATSNTSSSMADFSGVGDDNEMSYGVILSAAPITGNYTIASNGYGNLTVNSAALGDVSTLGVYMTDPNLNLNDPNNTSSGLGGGLLTDLDAVLPGGIGIVVPQTDSSVASFTGTYAFGAQAFNLYCCEFDFVAQGSVTSGALSGAGLVSDPFITLGGNSTNTGVTFSGTPLPDSSNLGRYTLSASNSTPNPLQITVGSTTNSFTVAIYQASGGLLFWMDEDFGASFFGMLQQQGDLTGVPAVRAKKRSAPLQHKSGVAMKK